MLIEFNMIKAEVMVVCIIHFSGRVFNNDPAHPSARTKAWHIVGHVACRARGKYSSRDIERAIFIDVRVQRSEGWTKDSCQRCCYFLLFIRRDYWTIQPLRIERICS